MLNIMNLNEHCLAHIFSYCSNKDLRNLCLVLNYFKQIINHYEYFKRSRDALLCGHRGNPSIGKITLDKLSYSDRFNLGENWREGKFRKVSFPTSGCYSKILLEKNYVYAVHNKFIRVHKRRLDRIISESYCNTITSWSDNEIVSFVKKDDAIFAGHKYHTCFIYENGTSTELRLHNTAHKLLSVDFLNSTYVTSNTGYTRIWQRTDKNPSVKFNMVKEYRTVAKSMKITSNGDSVYLGSYEGGGLWEIDLATGVEQQLNCISSIVQDIKLISDDVLLTANYDGTLRIYDRRLNGDVARWTNPGCSPLYCLQYDGLNGVLCGRKRKPQITLYDIRVKDSHVQVYNPFPPSTYCTRSSLVDIACDSRYLFITTHRNIRVLDFKSGDVQ